MTVIPLTKGREISAGLPALRRFSYRSLVYITLWSRHVEF